MRRPLSSWTGWLALAALALAPAPGGASDADGHPFDIEAGSMEYEFRRKLYVARSGDGERVVIRQRGRTLTADWVAYSRATRRGVASGDVVLSDGQDRLRTGFVEFDIDTLEGVMFDAELVAESTPLSLRGGEVARTGERTYAFREGRFTACRCPDPEDTDPWAVTAEQADLEVGGYGTARNTTLEVLGIPVVWLPWMLYPLKTERQSGLLFPEFAFSGRNGAEIGLPIFWAAGDPVNVTFTPRWLEKRGAKGDLEIEYVAGAETAGRFFGAGLWDDEVDANTPSTPFDKARWATAGEHDVHLPGRVRLKAQYGFASDNAYPNDFDDLGWARSHNFLVSRAFASAELGAAGVAGATLAAEHRDDLQNPDDTDRDRFVLQRLPSAEIQTLPTPLPFARWLVPALDAEYTWFQQRERPDAFYDAALLETGDGRFLDTGVDGLPTTVGGVGVEQGRDGLGIGTNPDPSLDNAATGGTEGDGFFQEGELLADEGHRVLLHPRLGAPLRIADVVELYPEVGWHETLYSSQAFGSERRGALTARAEARTRLRRDFGALVHLFEPQLGWALVEAPGQGGDPLFVPGTAVPQTRLRQLELENLTRDIADRIGDSHVVTLGFGNRIYRRSEGAPQLLADFVLQAAYDIENSRFGTVFLDGRAYPWEGMWSRFSVGFDADAGKLDEALFELGWADQRGDAVRIGFRSLRDVPALFELFPAQNRRFEDFRAPLDAVNQLDAGARIAITSSWAVGYRVAYSFERDLLLFNRGYVAYTSRCECWGLAVEVGSSRGRGFTIGIRYSLLGLGDDRRERRDDGGDWHLLDAFGGV